MLSQAHILDQRLNAGGQYVLGDASDAAEEPQQLITTHTHKHI